MTPAIIIGQAAQQDLEEQGDYLAERNLDAADRYSRAVQETLRQLAQLPGLGAPRDYGNPKLAGMRMRPVRGFEKYLIFYQPVEGGIEVIRVLHSARDIQSLFEAAE